MNDPFANDTDLLENKHFRECEIDASQIKSIGHCTVFNGRSVPLSYDHCPYRLCDCFSYGFS